MAGKKQQSSIIDNTTTCPYCGHRLLHKNLNKHIEKFHSEMEGRGHIAAANKGGAKSDCPHCSRKIFIHRMEEHIRMAHAKVIRSVDERLAEEQKKREEETLEKRKRIAKEYDAVMENDTTRDPEAPWEWRLAERQDKSQEVKSRKDSRVVLDYSSSVAKKTIIKKPKRIVHFVICAVCNLPVNKNRLDSHITKVHPNVVITGDRYTEVSDNPDFTTCPYCGLPVRKTGEAKHIRKHIN